MPPYPKAASLLARHRASATRTFFGDNACHNRASSTSAHTNGERLDSFGRRTVDAPSTPFHPLCALRKTSPSANAPPSNVYRRITTTRCGLFPGCLCGTSTLPTSRSPANEERNVRDALWMGMVCLETVFYLQVSGLCEFGSLWVFGNFGDTVRVEALNGKFNIRRWKGLNQFMAPLCWVSSIL